MKKAFFVSLISGGVIAALLLLALRPSAISRENAVEVDAVVTGVTKGGLNDIVISLRGVRGIHFIENGAEKGLSVDSLWQKLHGKKAAVWYAKPGLLTKLSPVTDTKRIVEVRVGNEVVYSLLQ